MENGFVTKDSGKRESFDTGAVRDVRSGKGRFDLISPIALKRLADVYERGAKKYDDRNWEKGMDYSRVIDSTLRHINQYMRGMEDEDHLAQAAWNLFAIMHYETTHPELNDLPFRQKASSITGHKKDNNNFAEEVLNYIKERLNASKLNQYNS